MKFVQRPDGLVVDRDYIQKIIIDHRRNVEERRQKLEAAQREAEAAAAAEEAEARTRKGGKSQPGRGRKKKVPKKMRSFTLAQVFTMPFFLGPELTAHVFLQSGMDPNSKFPESQTEMEAFESKIDTLLEHYKSQCWEREKP